MLPNLEKTLLQLRLTKPLVLCLTNHVTMDFVANCLLSLGAAPIMCEDARELEELIQISHAVNLNIGTLDTGFMLRASSAVELAKLHGKPIILDPVGAGATHIRSSAAKALLASAQIVRGNASEIMALSESVHETLGVEATHQVSDALDCARALAKTHQSTIVVSGADDFVTDGIQEEHLSFGSTLMPFVTGMGCALTAVIAAFRAVISDPYEASLFATAYFSLCGSLSAQKTTSPGTFRTLFIDQLYNGDFATMRSLVNAS